MINSSTHKITIKYFYLILTGKWPSSEVMLSDTYSKRPVEENTMINPSNA